MLHYVTDCHFAFSIMGTLINDFTQLEGGITHFCKAWQKAVNKSIGTKSMQNTSA